MPASEPPAEPWCSSATSPSGVSWPEPYDANTYGGCAQPDPCWVTEREAQIRSDAAAVRTTYALGYAAAGVGLALIGTELLLLPAPTAGGGSLHLSGRF